MTSMDIKYKAREIIVREVDNTKKKNNDNRTMKSECFACHLMYSIMHETNVDESSAADILSQVLSEDVELNERFIDALEYIHLYSRARALWFYSKTRSAKDDYLAMHVKNALTELRDEHKMCRDTMLRRLLLSYLSTYIAQIVGFDLHASTEELYYLLRRRNDLERIVTELLESLTKK